MVDSEERRRLAARLKEARLEAGFDTAVEAAREFRWKIPTYIGHENGTRGIQVAAAKKYARAFRLRGVAIEPADLLGLTTTGKRITLDNLVTISGAAAWGVWRDSAMSSLVHAEVPELPLPSRRRAGRMRYYLEIGDRSIDRHVPQGHFVIYDEIQADDDYSSLERGRFVVVRRRRDKLEEISVRVVESNEAGKLKLMAFSNDKRFNEVLELPAKNTEIIGLVVGHQGSLAEPIF